MSREDQRVVAAQIGRTLRGEWTVLSRCRFAYPTVVQTEPVLGDGTPFPTLYWLTCPWLVEEVSRLEGEGGTAEWATRLNTDDELASQQLRADVEYRTRRLAAAGGEDPCRGVGIAGQKDPLGTKCLHAHVASYLADIDDPVGKQTLLRVESECPDERCQRLAETEFDAGETVGGT